MPGTWGRVKGSSLSWLPWGTLEKCESEGQGDLVPYYNSGRCNLG